MGIRYSSVASALLTSDPVGELWTVNETCQRLSVSRRTIYNWMEDGRLEYVLLPSNRRLIKSASAVRPSEAELKR